jgi:protein SCO1/2
MRPHLIALVLSACTPEGPRHGDFTVQGVDGPLTLSRVEADATVVYFGYTSCPDVCPTMLSTVGRAFHDLSPAEQARVAGVFVSVDPERDTPARLAEYAAFFHPNLRGGTADPATVRAIADDWGVFYGRVDLPDSAMGYSVDHSTDAFLLDADHDVVERVPHGVAVDALVEQLRGVLD